MKIRGIVAVMVLGAASMMAQAAAPAADAAQGASQDAAKPAAHAACKRHEMGATKHACHCMKGKDSKMASHKHGMCPRMKSDSEKKS